MNTPSVFDSRDPRYKQPYGALLCGKEWSLTCRPLSSEGFTHCSVVIRREFLNEIGRASCRERV